MIEIGEYFCEPMVSVLACLLDVIEERSEAGRTSLVECGDFGPGRVSYAKNFMTWKLPIQICGLDINLMELQAKMLSYGNNDT